MESNTWCPRLTAWIILSGSAVHLKGFGSALCSTTKRLMAACKSTTDTKTPRFNRRFVSVAKKPSTALSQDAGMGVKWNAQRGCRASHWRTFGCANTVGAEQNDLGSPDMLVRGVAIPRERLQPATISGLESDGNSGSHAPNSHASSHLGIPSGIQMSDAIH